MRYNLANNEPFIINGDVYTKGIGGYDGTNPANSKDIATFINENLASKEYVDGQISDNHVLLPLIDENSTQEQLSDFYQKVMSIPPAAKVRMEGIHIPLRYYDVDYFTAGNNSARLIRRTEAEEGYDEILIALSSQTNQWVFTKINKQKYALESEVRPLFGIESYVKNGNFSNIVVFGDSITQGYASDPQTGTVTLIDGYISKLAYMSNATIVGNFAQRGFNMKSVYANLTQASNLNFDVVWIGAGTNDFLSQTPLGKFNQGSFESFYGTLKEMCRYFTTNPLFQGKRIIFLTPIPVRPNHPSDNVIKYPNRLEDYSEAIAKMATYYGFEVISGF